MRREYMGAARKARLAAPLGGTSLDLGILGDDLSGWPVGTEPFFIVIDRGLALEEKILCELRSANSLTVFTDGIINGRGADGTAIVEHAPGAYLEHIFTATDADEANEHVNSTANVHGVISDVVGVDDVQTLTNKSMSGTANTFTNLPQASVTGLPAVLSGLAATDVTHTADIAAVTAARIVTQAEVDALETVVDTKAPINNPTFTGTVTMPSTTSIGNVTGTEIAALDGVIANLQTQITGITGGGTSVPIGGDEGDVLVKRSGTDYDMEWRPASSFLGGGGTPTALVTAPYPTGGVVTTYISGVTGYEYRVHTFKTPYSPGAAAFADTFTNPVGFIGELLVAGGGGGDGGSGIILGGGTGGGGAVYWGPYAFGAAPGGSPGVHNMTIGSAGTGGGFMGYGSNGGDTRFDDVIAYGGGAGAAGGGASANNAGAAGGSGGGGTAVGGSTGGAATYGSLDAGVTTTPSSFFASAGGTGGGGGGAGASGIISISGSAVSYGQGGSGANDTGSGNENGVVIVAYRIA